MNNIKQFTQAGHEAVTEASVACLDFASLYPRRITTLGDTLFAESLRDGSLNNWNTHPRWTNILAHETDMRIGMLTPGMSNDKWIMIGAVLVYTRKDIVSRTDDGGIKAFCVGTAQRTGTLEEVSSCVVKRLKMGLKTPNLMYKEDDMEKTKKLLRILMEEYIYKFSTIADSMCEELLEKYSPVLTGAFGFDIKTASKLEGLITLGNRKYRAIITPILFGKETEWRFHDPYVTSAAQEIQVNNATSISDRVPWGKSDGSRKATWRDMLAMFNNQADAARMILPYIFEDNIVKFMVKQVETLPVIFYKELSSM